MGQYYLPVLGEPGADVGDFTVKTFAISHDFGSGLKLMEHSYIGNELLNRVEKELLSNPRPVVWAGDYADEEPNGASLYSQCEEGVGIVDGDVKVLGLQLMPPNPDPGWGNSCGEVRAEGLDDGYVVNHTKDEYCRLHPELDDAGDWAGWVHPLSLLTADGNGRGGGDYRGASSVVGRWARDVISVERADYDITGLDEIYADFQDDA